MASLQKRTSDTAMIEDMEDRPRYDDPTTTNTGCAWCDIDAHEFKVYYVNKGHGQQLV